MAENKQAQNTEKTAPEGSSKEYAKYMGTLNRIYGRNPNSKKKKLEAGIDSMKKGAQEQNEAPADGKKDHSFWFVLLAVVVVFGLYWVMNQVFF